MVYSKTTTCVLQLTMSLIQTFKTFLRSYKNLERRKIIKKSNFKFDRKKTQFQNQLTDFTQLSMQNIFVTYSQQ